MRSTVVDKSGHSKAERGATGSARADTGSRTETNAVSRYFNELRIEWSKITFPSKKELWQSTIVVFIFSIAVTMVIAFYDILVTLLFRFLLP